MSERFKSLAALIAAVMKAFFNIKEDDQAVEGGKQVAWTAAKRAAYAIADYWLAALCGSINIALKAWEVNLLGAFGVMWIINITIAVAFFLAYIKTGVDISLGENLRRSSDKIRESSRIGGYISMAGVIFQAIFWSGPEQIIIFFQKEIGKKGKAVVMILVLTAIQTAIWMCLYRTGYDIIKG